MNTNSNRVNCIFREASISAVALYVLHCHFEQNSSIIFPFKIVLKYSKIHSIMRIIKSIMRIPFLKLAPLVKKARSRNIVA